MPQLDYAEFLSASYVYVPVLFLFSALSFWHLCVIKFRLGALKAFWGRKTILGSLLKQNKQRLPVLMAFSGLLSLSPLLIIVLYSLELSARVTPQLSALHVFLICSFLYLFTVALGYFFKNGFFTAPSFKYLFFSSILIHSLFYFLPSLMFPNLSNDRTLYLGFGIINTVLVSVAVYHSLPFPRSDPTSYLKGQHPAEPVPPKIMAKKTLIFWVLSILSLFIYDVVSIRSLDHQKAFSFFSVAGIVIVDFLAFLHKWKCPPISLYSSSFLVSASSFQVLITSSLVIPSLLSSFSLLDL
ncbi:hypothetical protein GEMRC1_007153 [Eukaryota sp. GEM-RC1]